MHRYFIELSYNGTNYHGWQIQPNANTVQAELNAKFSTIVQEAVEVVGCGRTDTGVHARFYVAHIDLIDEIEDFSKICYKINSILPNDISIHRIFEVHADLHARFSAISRTYRYYVSTIKNPFLQNQAWMFQRSLNVDLMNEASNILLNQSDFAAFAKSHSDNATTLCNVTNAKWMNDAGLLIFEITANRFLRNMVRAIVGTIVDVGLGNITISDFIEIIESKNRSKAGFSVPACGLFLEEVSYTEI